MTPENPSTVLLPTPLEGLFIEISRYLQNASVTGHRRSQTSSWAGAILSLTRHLSRLLDNTQVPQHFVFGFHGFEVNDSVKRLIQTYHIGNIILMKRNIQNPSQTRRLVQDLQLLANDSVPLLIGIDQENGLVSAFSSPSSGTFFPGAMAIAASGSSELAEEISRASANELRMVGINWVYSPVADVNTDSRNPVIGVRSFGDDPVSVAKYASAVTRGHREGGVASSGKHFPGHGDTHVDSHLALPRILKTKEQILKEELIPFQSLVDAGIPSIMTGHMALPLITGDDTPCSLSRDITTGLLRDEMGFKGVIVTDCLEMDAISDPAQGGCGVQEGAIRAIEAGADIVMICHTLEWQVGAVEGVYKALEQGRVPIEYLTKSGARILKMKNDFARKSDNHAGDMDAGFSKLRAENSSLSQGAYLRSSTIVWNDRKVIPLKAQGKILLLTPSTESVNRAVDSEDGILTTENGAPKNTAGPSFLALARSLKRRVNSQHIVYGSQEDIPLKTLEEVQGVIFVMRNADQRGWQLEYLDRLGKKMREAKLPLVLISSCGPYDMGNGVWRGYREWTGYVATYEFTAEAFEAAVCVILGEEEGKGRLPVAVDLI